MDIKRLVKVGIILAGFLALLLCAINHAYALPTYTIGASLEGDGSISPSGDSTANEGDNAYYAITPAVGWHIEDVLIDGYPEGPLTSYTFTDVRANHTIHVIFAINKYTLTVINGSGQGVYNYGDNEISIIANTPSEGYYFVEWTGDTENISDIHASSTTISIYDNATVTAEFSNSYIITAYCGENGGIDPDGDVSVEYGNDQTFIIRPNDGYYINDALVDGSPQPYSGPGIYTFTNVDRNHTIEAVFIALPANRPPVVSNFPTYITNIGGHFAITDLDGYVEDPDNNDDEITWSYSSDSPELSVEIVTRYATITAQEGWSGVGTVTFTATDPGGLSDSGAATFSFTAIPTYTLDITLIGDGTVTRSAEGPYDADEIVTLTAVPGAGRFVYWTGPDAPLGREDEFEIAITMDYNKSLTANFLLYGDIDGRDGIRLNDLVSAFNHLLVPFLTDPIALKAADFDKNGVFGLNDVVELFNYVLTN